MLENKILWKTTVEGQDHLFLLPSGCQTINAFQAADEYRSYLYGKMKEQQEQQAQQKAQDVEPKPEG